LLPVLISRERHHFVFKNDLDNSEVLKNYTTRTARQRDGRFDSPKENLPFIPYTPHPMGSCLSLIVSPHLNADDFWFLLTALFKFIIFLEERMKIQMEKLSSNPL
jgi:hypothetical protein